ncbi:TonB-dependent receptor domain-containing protein [Hyphomicrobium sp. LHD-15]|uniref:TonB-dependent receptor n=1 Tax=Hyphomicrobium sp. LHD-15 TaxID=3072142 RepID=UPI00280CB2EC|nr:TonB-dependent receptor [Hyphomicrobium sp. LHD-15]MDQ8698884.1 TonB-dependent receptor [Hyphomicrobium sp. LHD-15]
MSNGILRGASAFNGSIKAALLGSAAVYLVLGLAGRGFDEAQAQSAVGQSAAQGITYNIPAQSLGSALTTFADRAGLKLLFPSSLVAGKSSPGLSGKLSRQQALSRLLAGTGLSYQFTSGNTVTIIGPGVGANDAAATLPGAIALDTIDVGDGGTESSADVPYQTPGSNAFISQENIERFRGNSAGDMFKGTPGVISGSNTNGAAINPNIRGLQGMNRVATSVDGAEQATSTYRGYYGVDNRTYVDPDLLGGVSITKGPSDGAQGASAIGGSVIMETLNASDILTDGKSYGVRIKGSVSDNSIAPLDGLATLPFPYQSIPGQTDGRTGDTSLLDFETKSGSFAAAFAGENIEVVGAIARRKSGNYFAGTDGPTTYKTPTGLELNLSPAGFGEEVLNTSEDSLSALFKTTLRFGDGHRLRLGYVHYENDFGEILPNTIRGGYRQLPLSTVETDSYTARYSWKPSFSDLIDLKVNSWFTNTDENSLQSDLIQVIDRKTNSETFGLNGSNTSRIETGVGKFAFNYGGSYVLEDVEPREPSTNNSYYIMSGTRETSSAFAKAEWEPWQWLKLDGGLQYLNYEVEDTSGYAGTFYGRPAFEGYHGDEVSPSYGLTITPVPGLQLFAKYMSGFRPPSIRESTWNSSGLTYNPNLKPEHASNWEYGANYLASDVFKAADKLRLKLAYFDNDYEDYLGRMYGFTPTWTLVTQIVNYDRVTMKGVEFSASYDAGLFFAETAMNYYTDFSYCRTATTCASGAYQSDYMVNQVPPEFTATTTLGVRLLEEKLTLGARHTFVSASIGDFLYDPTSFASLVTVPWPEYHLFDLFAEWKYTDEVQFGFSANNITDRYYVDPLSNALLPSPGRTLRADLTMKF